MDYGSFILKYPTALQAKKTESPIKEDEKGNTYLLLEVSNETGTFSVARIRISEKTFAKNIESRVEQTRQELEAELGTQLLSYESELTEWKTRQTLVLRYSYPFGEGYTMYKTQYFMMAGDYTYVFTISNIDSEVPKFSKSFWIAFPCRIKMARQSPAWIWSPPHLLMAQSKAKRGRQRVAKLRKARNRKAV